MSKAPDVTSSTPQAVKPYPPLRRAEASLAAQATVLAAIALQLLLPERLTAGPTWLLPALEGALLVGLSLATPRQIEREHPPRRGLALGMTALVSVANVISLALLVHLLLHHGTKNGQQLIVAGALIWITNVLIFGFWYLTRSRRAFSATLSTTTLDRSTLRWFMASPCRAAMEDHQPTQAGPSIFDAALHQ